MARVFDEDDYRRRVDQALGDLSTGEEIGLLARGFATGNVFGPLDERIKFQVAKVEALRKARKAMMRAIRDEEDRIRRSAIIPIDVTELATGASDDLVKVP